MTVSFDDEGNITTFVGDTILFDIHDVPTDLNYTIYFRVYDKNNNTVIPETAVNADYQDTVTIEISPSTTDFVSIPSGKKSVTHYYGIKACNAENDVEHTQTVDGVDVSQETKITFMRKRVEGDVPPEPTEPTTPTEPTEPTTPTEPTEPVEPSIYYAWRNDDSDYIYYTTSLPPAQGDTVYSADVESPTDISSYSTITGVASTAIEATNVGVWYITSQEALMQGQGNYIGTRDADYDIYTDDDIDAGSLDDIGGE